MRLTSKVRQKKANQGSMVTDSVNEKKRKSEQKMVLGKKGKRTARIINDGEFGREPSLFVKKSSARSLVSSSPGTWLASNLCSHESFAPIVQMRAVKCVKSLLRGSCGYLLNLHHRRAVVLCDELQVIPRSFALVLQFADV